MQLDPTEQGNNKKKIHESTIPVCLPCTLKYVYISLFLLPPPFPCTEGKTEKRVCKQYLPSSHGSVAESSCPRMAV